MQTHVERGFPWHLVMIAEKAFRGVGTIRFDAAVNDITALTWEVSIVVSPIDRGHGIGGEMLAKGCKKFTLFPIIAEIRKDNIASQKIFERCGFRQVEAASNSADTRDCDRISLPEIGDFIQYRREPQP
jgi:RimJ/RimL family protein N-acetyltransferase